MNLRCTAFEEECFKFSSNGYETEMEGKRNPNISIVESLCTMSNASFMACYKITTIRKDKYLYIKEK